jgi:hypothetical protein
VTADPYCSGAHPDGWLCVLAADHDGPHLSIDNRCRWRHTVGLPVRWRSTVDNLPPPDDDLPSYGDALVAAIQQRTGGALPLHTTGDSPPVLHSAPQPTDTPTAPPTPAPAPATAPGSPVEPAAAVPVPTGDSCDVCGQVSLVRESACRTRCMACGAIDGGCG